VFVLWNLGLIYQFKKHLMPWYTTVYWEEILYNQFRVVPGQVFHDLCVKLSFRCDSSN
jgi:hypothetical protein